MSDGTGRPVKRPGAGRFHVWRGEATVKSGPISCWLTITKPPGASTWYIHIIHILPGPSTVWVPTPTIGRSVSGKRKRVPRGKGWSIGIYIYTFRLVWWRFRIKIM